MRRRNGVTAGRLVGLLMLCPLAVPVASWAEGKAGSAAKHVPTPVAATGETLIEAEDYTRGNFTINPTGWGRGPSPIIQDPMSPDAGPGFSEYDLQFAASGRYALSAKYASAEPRQAAIVFDGALVDAAALTGTTGSFEGASAKWFPVAVIPVSAGRHTLRLQHAGTSLPHVDAFRLQPTREPLRIPALAGRPEARKRLLDRTGALTRALPRGESANLPQRVACAAADWQAAWEGAYDLAPLVQALDNFAQRWAPLFREALIACTAHGYGVADSGLGYAVGVECPARKVFWSVLDFQGDVGAPARVSLARGEYESLQVVLLAGDEPLHGVRVTVSDLIGPEGMRLPADCVELHPVGYVEASSHPEKGETEGDWHPDPLLVNRPFGVAAHHAQPVWVTVHAPEGVRAGEYKGIITIAPRGAPRVCVPLIVKVWDFILPPEGHLRTTFVLWWSRQAISRPEFEQWMEFVLRYRLGVMDIGWGWSYPEPVYPIRRTETGYDYTRLDEDLQWCFDRHMNSVSMADFPAGTYAEDYIRELRRFLADYARHLRQRGWFDKAYLKLQDEPQPDHYAAVRAQGELVKSIDPAIRRLCTVRIVPELIGAVDIWCPITTQCDPQAAAAARERGEEVWVYTCGAPAPPAPNIAYVHQETLGSRLLPWHCWRLGAGGYLYWSIKHWPDANTRAKNHQWSAWKWAEGSKTRFVPRERTGKGWPALAWISASPGLAPGDGYVAYPGPHGEPLPSIRLQAFRDGLEDVEYLHAIRERKSPRAQELLRQAAALIGLHGEHDADPSKLLRLREEIGDELGD